MRRRPPRPKRTDTLFPYTTLFRSPHMVVKPRGGRLDLDQSYPLPDRAGAAGTLPARFSRRSGPWPRAFSSLPAKAGGEEVRLRATGSRADERTPAVLAGRTGWGGVSFGSARTVATPPSLPLPSQGEGPKRTAGPGVMTRY